MTVLAIEDVSLAFGGLSVLKNVSMSVGKGEILALIGPNGAGKTSVFNCISGIYRPSGSIRFGERELIGMKPHQVARLGIARTFQHGEVPPHMTVVEAVMSGRHRLMELGLVPEMLRLPSARAAEAAHRDAALRIIEHCEIAQYADAQVGALAFGIQKIVGCARALAAEPALLLLDEPSAGLTQEEREAMARFIMRVKVRLGLPMIWIEHDMQMVAELADRIHVLDYGRSLVDAAPDIALKHPDVIAAYLGA